MFGLFHKWVRLGLFLISYMMSNIHAIMKFRSAVSLLFILFFGLLAEKCETPEMESVLKWSCLWMLIFFSSHNNSNEWNLIVTIIFLWYSCNLSMGCNGPTMGLVHDLWELATDFYNMIAFPTPWTRIKRGSGCSMEPTQTKPVQISILHIIGHVTHQLWIEVHLNHNWPVVWCCNLGGAKLGPTWPHLTKVKLSLGLFGSGSPRLGSGFVNPNLTLVPNLSVWTNDRVRWTHLVIIKLTLTTHLWGSLLWKYVRRFLILLFFPGYYCRI